MLCFISSSNNILSSGAHTLSPRLLRLPSPETRVASSLLGHFSCSPRWFGVSVIFIDRNRGFLIQSRLCRSARLPAEIGRTCVELRGWGLLPLVLHNFSQKDISSAYPISMTGSSPKDAAQLMELWENDIKTLSIGRILYEYQPMAKSHVSMSPENQPKCPLLLRKRCCYGLQIDNETCFGELRRRQPTPAASLVICDSLNGTIGL
jgi:hypothetical protein